jgi:hypothetical protein
VGIRDRLRRLEEEAEGQILVIPQKDGTVKRFPPGAGIDANINFMDRLGAGEDPDECQSTYDKERALSPQRACRSRPRPQSPGRPSRLCSRGVFHGRWGTGARDRLNFCCPQRSSVGLWAGSREIAVSAGPLLYPSPPL